jgi:poly(beta-D-mannuronate) lyase
MDCISSRRVASRSFWTLTFATLCFGIQCFGALLSAPAYAAAPLQSPWDSHPVALTDRPYICADPQHLSPNLTSSGYYTDEHHSIVDPAAQERYKEITTPYQETAQRIVDAADAYQTSGSRAAAACSVSLIEAAARDRFLAGAMNGSQSYFTQKWLVGAIAIAYLKVRPSGVATPAQTAEIAQWLKHVAAQSMDFADPPNARHTPGHALNNHRYWAGLEVAAIAIATDDNSLWKWGIESAEVGIKQIQKEGTLPLEMDRAGRALHYHLFAAGPLVMLAEFASVNGKDLYAERSGALQRLVERSVSGVTDPSYFRQKTGVEQEVPSFKSPVEYAWLRPYVRRFPNPAISALLAKLASMSGLYLGGLPPE